MGGVGKALDWISDRRFLRWAGLILPGTVVYAIAEALIHRIWGLSAAYALPIVIPIGLIAGLFVYALIASRPKPSAPLPPVSIVLEPYSAMPLRVGDLKVTTPSLVCRFYVTNNKPRAIKITHARLRSADVSGQAEMFSGETRLANPVVYMQEQPRVGEIALDHTEMVFCNFPRDVDDLIAKDEYSDTVELFDQDGNAYPVPVLFGAVRSPV